MHKPHSVSQSSLDGRFTLGENNSQRSCNLQESGVDAAGHTDTISTGYLRKTKKIRVTVPQIRVLAERTRVMAFGPAAGNLHRRVADK
jgi:hypothetical protein